MGMSQGDQAERTEGLCACQTCTDDLLYVTRHNSVPVSVSVFSALCASRHVDCKVSSELSKSTSILSLGSKQK